MKKFIAKLILICALLTPFGTFAQMQPENFTIILLGTKHYSDVDIIKKNIQKLSSVKNFQPLISSQKHVEFSGTFSGDKDSFVADVESLATDRFVIQSKNDKNRGLVITLRKIGEK